MRSCRNDEIRNGRNFSTCRNLHSAAGEGFQALKDAAYPDHTLWSVIYDKKNLTSTICFDRNWDSPLSFSIDMK